MIRATRSRGLCLVALASAVAALLWWRSHETQHPGTTVSSAAEPGPFLNAHGDVAYVGTTACADCHPRQYDSYLRTMHSRSLGSIDPDDEPPDASIEVPGTGRVYSVYREEGRLRHRESLRTEDGSLVVLADHAQQYVVGSGHLSRTYLGESGGFLFESPITWYASRREWGLSPGYERDDPGFARAVYFECMNCHAGHVKSEPASDARMKVIEKAIGCERCHGPGELHVREREAQGMADAARGVTIVNPARLDRERSESICAQCHLDGKAAVEVSHRRSSDYRPGLRWSDFRTDYGQKSGDRPMTVVGHVEQLRASRCYQQTETLTCTTCHDPHARPDEDERIAHYRRACLSCHERDGCKLPEPERLARSHADDCTSCHMPPTSSDIPHIAATHHRVGIHAASAAVEEVHGGPGREGLAPLFAMSHLSMPEQNRSLGLAYLQWSLKEPDREGSNARRLEARKLLRSALKDDPADGEVLAALALVESIEAPSRTVQLGEAALQGNDLSPRSRSRALFAVSEAHCKLHRLDAALPFLEELVLIRRQGSDWFRLAVCRRESGQLAGAIEAARTAVAIMPEQPRFRELLAELCEQQGDRATAFEQRRLARQIAAARASP